MDEREILRIVQSLSLEEKAALCSGLDNWYTKPNAQKSIPSLFMSDGPHGVRVEDTKNAKENGGASKPATCFPPAVTSSCSWSEDILSQMGAAIAEECLNYGVGLLLGPGVNIKRHPLCGRNFEYYSEDGLLAGRLAAAFINGVQQKGVGTSLKHFAVNNQEKWRMSIDAEVDDRALFDIYLKAFEIAVKEAAPATVMASYNKVNGVYATENRRLLFDILRMKFGFDGAVVTDWGAVRNRVQGVAAGCELEMPGTNGINDAVIVKAVRDGTLSEDALDTVCWNMLKLIFKYSRDSKPAIPCDFEAHNNLAQDILCKSTVLLKNDGMLPLSRSGKLSVIGMFAKEPRFQGGGSSVVNPTKITSFITAMGEANLPFEYAQGYENGDLPEKEALVNAAIQAAKTAADVVLFLGLPDSFECEGYDREHLHLPKAQTDLLDKIAAVNSNICVVLCCGGPVHMPWLSKVRAVLCPHLGGQAMGTALIKLLYGDENPSGKLTESWPLAIEDTPAYHHFPMGPHKVRYNESIFVGYRYYDTANKAVLFPFGHGLSYTKFEYGKPKLSCDVLPEDGVLKVEFELKNIGDAYGEEIVQLYISRQNSARMQPAQELLAFKRVPLKADETQKVQFDIEWQSFAFHDTQSGTSVVEESNIELRLAASSRDVKHVAGVFVQGVQLSKNTPDAQGSSYGNISDNTFSDDNFAILYNKPLGDNKAQRKGEYNLETPLGVMNDTVTGRSLLRLATFAARRSMHFSKDEAANLRAANEMTFDLPVKNLPPQTGGRIGHKATAALLDMCNGKHAFFRFIGAFISRK